MTVGELYRAIGKYQTVRLIQSNVVYFHGKADDIPLHYMDASVEYFKADYEPRSVSTFIVIVLCE